MSAPALIALGGNRGDVRAGFRAALARLHGTPGVRVTAASRAYRTPAVGAEAGGAFLNAAAAVETSLSPRELLTELHRVEAAAGRVRTVRWGPRELDLDLILFGADRADEPGLTVPHPGLAWRRFVLDPACEVAADWPVPGSTAGAGTVGALRAALLARPLPISLEADLPAELWDELAAAFPVRLTAGGSDRPALRLVREDSAAAGPGVFRVPTGPAAVGAARDAFAAALPDPPPVPVGPPLWP